MKNISTYRIAIIGNGDVNVKKKELAAFNYVIAADGGANYCLEIKYKPNIIIGDGDSISDEAQEYCKDIPQMYNQDQNTTDLEKALQHAHSLHNKVEITLYGCTSHRRLDHTQAAIQWLTKDPTIRLLASPLQSIVFVDDKLLLPNPDRLNWRVSIVPYTKTATVNLAGMEWSGKQIVLNEKRSAISNVTTGYTPSIRVTKGSVLVFVG